MSKEHKHPPQPYTHNLNKVCKIDGCTELGYLTKCNICGQQKRKVMCEKHLGLHKESNRILRGKLTAGIFYKTN